MQTKQKQFTKKISIIVRYCCLLFYGPFIILTIPRSWVNVKIFRCSVYLNYFIHYIKQFISYVSEWFHRKTDLSVYWLKEKCIINNTFNNEYLIKVIEKFHVHFWMTNEPRLETWNFAGNLLIPVSTSIPITPPSLTSCRTHIGLNSIKHRTERKVSYRVCQFQPLPSCFRPENYTIYIYFFLSFLLID